jgi:hypothetical protein
MKINITMSVLLAAGYALLLGVKYWKRKYANRH